MSPMHIGAQSVRRFGLLIAAILVSGQLSIGAQSDLRSAYLGPDQWPASLQPEEIKSQLQMHFAEVVHRLECQAGESLDIALDRAEQVSGPWSVQDRAQMRDRLAGERNKQITRIVEYARRGLFPANEGQSDQSVPIFVDRHGTHCAVGYLMHRDGKDESVAAIVDFNNLVVVPDVKSGVLVDWVLFSGLTQEEAALIQPGYPPPDFDVTLEQMQSTTPTVEKAGYTVSGFSVREVSYGDPVPPPPFNWSVAQSFLGGSMSSDYRDPSNVGLRLDSGTYIDPTFGAEWEPTLGDWVFLGNNELIPQFGMGLPVAGPGVDTVVFEMQYDIVSNDGPFTEFGMSVSGHFNFNSNNDGGLYVLTQAFDTNGVMVGEVEWDDEDFVFFGTAPFVSFPVSTDQLQVKTFVAARDGAVFSSVFHEFHSVPEPAACCLWSLAAIGIVMGWRRRFRGRTSGPYGPWKD